MWEPWQVAPHLADHYEDLALSAHLRVHRTDLVFSGVAAYRDAAEYWREAASFTPPDNPRKAFRADRAQLMRHRAAEWVAREGA